MERGACGNICSRGESELCELCSRQLTPYLTVPDSVLGANDYVECTVVVACHRHPELHLYNLHTTRRTRLSHDRARHDR